MRSLPQARTDQLVIHEFDEETLVYDLKRHRAHCLSPAARLVWHHCDGQSCVEEMAGLLHSQLGLPADPELVGMTLRRLGRAHLLQERPEPAFGTSRSSRRALIQKLGSAGAVSLLLSLVTSLAVPRAAAAASCVLEHDPCTPGVSVCCDNRGCEFDQGIYQCI
jgi:hypothetical protein